MAMQQYDANRDGTIDAEELKKSPPLMEAVEPSEIESHSPMDANGDRLLTEEEIRDRVADWLRSDTVVLTQSAVITFNGTPLEGATVTFEPEEFLGPALVSCTAVTDRNGHAFPTGQDEKYPGLYVGLYRIRISKIVDGREILPACYHRETILGKEIASDAPSTHRGLVFHLKGE